MAPCNLNHALHVHQWSVTPQPTYPRIRSHWHPLDEGLARFQNRSACFTEKTFLSHEWERKQDSHNPNCSPVTTLTELLSLTQQHISLPHIKSSIQQANSKKNCQGNSLTICSGNVNLSRIIEVYQTNTNLSIDIQRLHSFIHAVSRFYRARLPM